MSPPVTIEEAHYLHSNLRESIVEYLFVGCLLRALWRQGRFDVEVSRSEFDGFGYDLVIELGGAVRHIQLKSSRRSGKTKAPQPTKISEGLTQKPSGCVIWIDVDDALNLGPFYWYGGGPGSQFPLMDEFRLAKRIGRQSSGAQPLRKRHRNIPRSEFVRLEKIEDVVERLFGSVAT